MWSLAWPVAFVVAIALTLWRAEVVARYAMDRWVELHQPEIDARVSVQAAPDASDPMPYDLEAHSLLESEPWAREQTIAAVKDAYEQHRDWTKVRAMVSE